MASHPSSVSGCLKYTFTYWIVNEVLLLTRIWETGHAGGRQPVVSFSLLGGRQAVSSAPSTSKEASMARTADHQGDSPRTADGGQRRPPQEQRAPEPEAAVVVLTSEGQRRLAVRAAWLATDWSPGSRTTRPGGPAGSTSGP